MSYREGITVQVVCHDYYVVGGGGGIGTLRIPLEAQSFGFFIEMMSKNVFKMCMVWGGDGRGLYS